jgi:hypothetical protein
MAAGIINGAFGFRFALTRWNYVYAPLVLIVIIFLFVSSGLKYYLAKKRAKNGAQGRPGGPPPFDPNAPQPTRWDPPPQYPGPQQQQQQPQYMPPQGPPPSGPYNDGGWAAETRSRDDIPLQNMETVRPKQYV